MGLSVVGSGSGGQLGALGISERPQTIPQSPRGLHDLVPLKMLLQLPRRFFLTLSTNETPAHPSGPQPLCRPSWWLPSGVATAVITGTHHVVPRYVFTSPLSLPRASGGQGPRFTHAIDAQCLLYGYHLIN